MLIIPQKFIYTLYSKMIILKNVFVFNTSRSNLE